MGVTATINATSSTNASESYDFEIWAAIGIPIVTLGIFSNTFFFISVGLAVKNSRHGFGVDVWKWIILLNLSLVDFCYCFNYFVNGSIGLSNVEPGTYPWLCQFLIVSRSKLSAIDGWSVGAFAFNMAFPNFW